MWERGELGRCKPVYKGWINKILLWGPLVAQMMKNPPAVQETWVQSLGCKDPLEKEMAIYSSILGASLVAQMVMISTAMQETQVQSLEIPWRREWLPTPVFLPAESHGQRSLLGYSPWGRTKSDTTEVTNP